MDLERAPLPRLQTSDVIKLASNESPWGPHPKVLEAVTKAAASANRYPDQYAALLRQRLADLRGSNRAASPSPAALRDPPRRLAGAVRARGRARLPWPPSRCTRSSRRCSAPRDPRAAERPLRARPRGDAAEITVATQLVIICNNNPTGTALPAACQNRSVPRAPRPRQITVILDEAYIGAGARRPRHHGRPAPEVPEPGPAPRLLQGLWPRGPALRLRAGLGEVPRRSRCSTSPSASTCSRRRPGRRRSSTADDVAERVGGRSSSASRSRRSCAGWAWRRPTRRRTSPGSTSAIGTEPRSSRASAAPRSSAPALRSADPATSRVGYGTPAENLRFVETLRGLL